MHLILFLFITFYNTAGITSENSENGIVYKTSDPNLDFSVNNINSGRAPSIIELTTNTAPKGYYLGEVVNSGYNSEINLYCSLPYTQHIRISEVSIIGEESDVLINERLETGTYKFHIKNNIYSSGIRFFRVETETFTELRKVKIIN